MHLFIRENAFFIVCEDRKFVSRILKQISAYDKLEVSFGRLLFHLFDKLLEDDNSYWINLKRKLWLLRKRSLMTREIKTM